MFSYCLLSFGVAEYRKDGDTNPIWGLRSRADAALAVRLARTRGIKPRRILFDEFQLARKSHLAGTVLSAEGPVAEFCELYAALTGRPIEKSLEHNHEPAKHTPLVLISLRSETTSDFFQAHFSNDQSRSVGVIVLPSLGEARRTTIRAAFVAIVGTQAPDSSAPSIAQFDAWDRSSPATGTGRKLGSRATSSEVRQLLGSGSDLLTISAHSDGIDTSLGGSVLCPLSPAALDAKVRTHLPECVEAGRCHRFNAPVESALHDSRRIDPAEVAARVLLLNSCWGVLPAGGPVDPSYGLFSALLVLKSIDCIIAPWALIASSGETVQPLVDAISCGTSVGEAVHVFNCSEVAKRSATRMAVFGDPEYRIASYIGRRPRDSSPTPPPPDFASILFLRVLLESWRRNSDGDLQRQVLRSIKLATAAEESATRGILPGALASAIKEGFLNLALTFNASVSHHWVPLASAHSSGYARPCWCCGTRSVAITFKFKVSALSDRRLTICDTCGVIRDESVLATERCLQLPQPRTISVQPIPVGNENVVVHFGYRDTTLNEVFSWPKDGDNYRAHFEVPRHIHGRLARTTVLVFDELKLSTYAVRHLRGCENTQGISHDRSP